MEPWFDPNAWSWLPGTLLGCLGGLWGTLAGILVPQNRGRTLVWGLYFLLLFGTLGCLIAGLIALLQGQPYGIWFGLLMGGAGIIVLGPFAWMLRYRYRQVEEEQMMRKDAF